MLWTNLSNASALLNQALPNSVFTGFLLDDGSELIWDLFRVAFSCVHLHLEKESAVSRLLNIDDYRRGCSFA